MRHLRLLAAGAALWFALSATVLCLVLASFGFLAAGLFLWLETHFGAAAAAALTAAGTLALALLTLLLRQLALRRLRRRLPGMFEDAAGTLTMLTSLASLLIRQDPKRAILLALAAGALVEYLTRGE